MGLRREARELAMQMLFAIDADSSVNVRETMQVFREENTGISGTVRAFAEELVTGVNDRRELIDSAIRGRSKNWSLSRMPRVDLNVMRIAVYELMYRPDIPKKVTINEAIEVVRRFGDKESPAFVNGILDEIDACEKTELSGENNE